MQLEPKAWLVISEPRQTWHFARTKEDAERISDNLLKYAARCTSTTIEPLYLQAVQPVPVAWQPIETAPKEGAYFIYQPAEKSGRYVLPARILLNGDGGRRTSSHWMPLPAAPVSGGHNAK